jgi:hypothetical protein
LLPKKTLPESRTYLRGYSWITVCPEELSSRLDVEALLGNGDFCEVERLASGGTWLQATPNFVDYDIDQVRRVWVALSPLLRPGVPLRREEKPGRPPLPVIYEDARFAQSSSGQE